MSKLHTFLTETIIYTFKYWVIFINYVLTIWLGLGLGFGLGLPHVIVHNVLLL